MEKKNASPNHNCVAPVCVAEGHRAPVKWKTVPVDIWYLTEIWLKVAISKYFQYDFRPKALQLTCLDNKSMQHELCRFLWVDFTDCLSLEFLGTTNFLCCSCHHRGSGTLKLPLHRPVWRPGSSTPLEPQCSRLRRHFCRADRKLVWRWLVNDCC